MHQQGVAVIYWTIQLHIVWSSQNYIKITSSDK